jgi:multiple sugar transport system ATP-binding protein
MQASKEQPAENAVKGHVQLAEHLGDAIFLHATMSGATDSMTIRTDPDNPVDTGDMAWLTLPPARCFLFNEQGKTLARAS